MTPPGYTEDTLVQQTATEYLEHQLGWELVYAYNTETFGSEGTFGRRDDREVVLTRYLHVKLMEFNLCLPDAAYMDAVLQITIDFPLICANSTMMADKLPALWAI